MSSGAPMWKLWIALSPTFCVPSSPNTWFTSAWLAVKTGVKCSGTVLTGLTSLLASSISRSGLRWTLPKVVVPRWTSARNGSDISGGCLAIKGFVLSSATSVIMQKKRARRPRATT